MTKRARQTVRYVVALALGSIGVLVPGNAMSSATFGYDESGRLGSALYDNGLCVAYAYDPAGNRTSQANTIGSAPEQAVWGTGSWGCLKWSP